MRQSRLTKQLGQRHKACKGVHNSDVVQSCCNNLYSAKVCHELLLL